MSYRDVRNFIEMTRALGYTSLISMESFRQPNFHLLADILLWLAKRFDPDCEISQDIASESERVKFIRNIAEFMALKANIKLNTKRLYQADGYAIKEMVKITQLLYDALNINPDQDTDSFEESFNLKEFDLSDKVNELKLSRQLASEITSTGATLFDLLGKEVELRAARQKSLTRPYELDDINAGIRQAVDALKAQIAETKGLIDNVAASESNLDAKIERRKIEIDRYEKRLQTLKKVRPAFLEEFTVLEAELEELFVHYSMKTRVLNHLEQLVKEAERIQLEKQLEITSPRIETIPLDDDPLLAMDEEEKGGRQERPRAGTGGGRLRTAKTAKAYGGMQPPISATPSLSSDTESDDLFIDKDESELLHSDDESLGLELSEMGVAKSAKRAQSTAKNPSSRMNDNSDDDF